jgi:hypothetical protein
MPFYNLHLDHVKLIPHPSIIEYTLRRQPSEILQSGQQKLPENNTINLKKLLNEADQTDRNVRYTLTLLMIDTMSSRQDKAPYEDSRSMSLAYAFCFGSDSAMLKKSAMTYKNIYITKQIKCVLMLSSEKPWILYSRCIHIGQ